MTAFITPCWRKRLERSLRLCVVGLSTLAAAVFAGVIQPQQARLIADEQGYALSAQFSVALGERLEEAVARGVPLNFRLEFTLERKRKYWVNEHLVSALLHYRLTYHALTRQYRLAIGGLQQHFASLDEALAALARVSRWPVAEAALIVPGETYLAAVRLSLDHEQLPKPLQVDALADPEWRVEAQTQRWSFEKP